MPGAGAAAAARGRSPVRASSHAFAELAKLKKTVRIDRFLFFIRLVKSRTLAQAVIEQGYVRIDGKRVEKPSDEVRVGSIIALAAPRQACASSGFCSCPAAADRQPKRAPAMTSWELTRPKRAT